MCTWPDMLREKMNMLYKNNNRCDVIQNLF